MPSRPPRTRLAGRVWHKLSFDARNYGYASLTKLMAATQVFELRDEGTARVAVRDLRGHQDEVLP